MNKASSSLTEKELKEKKANLPTIKLYNQTIAAGESECQLLVETATDAQLLSPAGSVNSEMIHTVVMNMTEE